MLPIRIKACSESDLRMLGNLARNIQRVLPVTQADIDAAAALGKEWVVWKVFEVTDPLDNLRGGTQLVIKQNSIQPGQNVRRVLIVQDPASKTVVILGKDYIVLPDAIFNSLQYVKAFGETQQNGVPQEYTRLDRLQGDGDAYIDLGITLNQDDEIEVDFIFKYASGSQIFGYRESASARNITLFFGSGAGSIYMDFNDSGYTDYRLGTTGTDDAQYTAKISKTKRALYSGATEIAANSTACPDTFTTGNALLFFAGGSPSGAAKFAGSILEVRIKDRMHLVPAKRNSDDVLGMYDMITGQFFTNAAESGAFIAGTPVVPTPAYPIDIVSNNGALKARHQSGLPLGYDLLDKIVFNGTQELDTDFICNQDTRIVSKFNGSVNNSWVYGTGVSNPRVTCYLSTTGNERFGNVTVESVGITSDTINTVIQDKNGFYFNNEQGKAYTNVGTFTTLTTLTIGNSKGATGTPLFSGDFYYLQIFDNNVLARNYLPVKRRSDDAIGFYDLVNGDFLTSANLVAGDPVSDPVEIYTDGTIETIEDALGNTATAEMLLKVGNYQDVQSILDGVVTRKVGVLVLDGTEEIWGSTSQTPDYVSILSNCYTVAIPLGDGSVVKRRVYCTHLNSSDTLPDANARQGYALLGNGGSGTPEPLTNKYAVGLGLTTSFPTIAGLKQWLAAQYAAGTPVIVVYPLATETTESVAGQTLQVQVGDNILEITQASLNGLELEAKYQAAVSLTIQEVQDANLDQNVEVTIN